MLMVKLTRTLDLLLPEFNTVTSRYSRDNRLKRVFGYNSHFWRSPADTEEGNYPGWNKTDATSEFKELWSIWKRWHNCT